MKARRDAGLSLANLQPVAAPMRPVNRSSGFTLVELMIATVIFGLVSGLMLVAYTGVAKRAYHTDATIKGSAELRYATDLISRSVRSASQLPTVSADGLQLIVPPFDLGVAIVTGPGTAIGPAGDGMGYKGNQRMIKLSNFTGAAATSSIFNSANRPAGVVSAGQVSTYFKPENALEVVDLNDVFSVGDTVTIPATAYGDEVQRVISSISNNSGNKTLTFTADLGVDVPLDTLVRATSGKRIGFQVVTAVGETNGELRYYPDNSDRTRFMILARDVDPSPLLTPSVSTSGNTTPFVLNERFLTINLQRLPAGRTFGRTVQGVQTTVLARTNPDNP